MSWKLEWKLASIEPEIEVVRACDSTEKRARYEAKLLCHIVCNRKLTSTCKHGRNSVVMKPGLDARMEIKIIFFFIKWNWRH